MFDEGNFEPFNDVEDVGDFLGFPTNNQDDVDSSMSDGDESILSTSNDVTRKKKKVIESNVIYIPDEDHPVHESDLNDNSNVIHSFSDNSASISIDEQQVSFSDNSQSSKYMKTDSLSREGTESSSMSSSFPGYSGLCDPSSVLSNLNVFSNGGMPQGMFSNSNTYYKAASLYPSSHPTNNVMTQMQMASHVNPAYSYWNISAQYPLPMGAAPFPFPQALPSLSSFKYPFSVPSLDAADVINAQRSSDLVNNSPSMTTSASIPINLIVQDSTKIPMQLSDDLAIRSDGSSDKDNYKLSSSSSSSSPMSLSNSELSPNKTAMSKRLSGSSNTTSSILTNVNTTINIPIIAATATQKQKDPNRKEKSLSSICARFIEFYGKDVEDEVDSDIFFQLDSLNARMRSNSETINIAPSISRRRRSRSRSNSLTIQDPLAIRIDEAAKVLGVHIRRVYEVLSILEVLSLVSIA